MIETHQPCQLLKDLVWLAYVFHLSIEYFLDHLLSFIEKQNDLPKFTGQVAPTIIRKSKRFLRRLICVDYLVLLYRVKGYDPRGTKQKYYNKE